MSIRNWSTTAASNNSAPPNGAPEGMAPSGVNNTMRQMMADVRDTVESLPFFDYGHTATRVDADTFTIASDVTSIYTAGRSLKLVGATTEYGSVSSSSYSAPDTTINIVGTVPTSLSTVSVGIVGAQVRYEQTAAELAAGVTPTNFYEEPGVLDRYLTNSTPGTTDMTNAWVAANAQSAQGGAPIKIKRVSGGYAFASAISVDYRSEVDAEDGAFIIYTGSGEIAFLTIGTAGQVAQYRAYSLPMVRRASQSNWTNEANIGIKFLNISDCPLAAIPQVNGFTIGVQTLPAGGGGFQYNKIRLGNLLNNKIGLDLSNATSGYTNENTWEGGRFSVNSGVNNTLARYGVRITSSDASYTDNNNNVFIKPSFELNASDTSGEAVPVLMTHGQQNTFWMCRDENNDTPFAREANASSENKYIVGYSNYVGLPTIETGSTSVNYIKENSRSQVLWRPTRVIFNSGPMHKRACYYDGGTNVHIPNVAQASINNATVFSNGSNVTFNSNYLSFSTGGIYFPAIFVDTTRVKEFLVSKDVEAGFGGRVAIQCYSAQGGGGSIITTASSVKGTAYNGFSSSSNFGNVFQTGSDGDDDVYFQVSSAVKSIRVIIFGADANLRIRSFEIIALNTTYHAAAQTGYDEIIPGANIGTAAPTSGTWPQGFIVWNTATAAGGSPGWICTTAGTPGTWKSMANVAA